MQSHERVSGHSTSQNVNALNIDTIEFPLPPSSEQRRIVAKVEELLKHVNASRDHLAKASKILKAFRQSVLAAACSGRLTEDWRERHPTIETRPSDDPHASGQKEEAAVESTRTYDKFKATRQAPGEL